MGGSSWSDRAYSDRVSTRSVTNAPVFAYSAKVQRGEVAQKVHPTLDPKGLNGKVRESRDSAAHPESNAIVVSLDVTGSMGSVVKGIHSKLPALMGLLTKKDYIKDPQILFLSIGDAYSDMFPLQVGQFESGIEMEDHLTNMILEGAGGGGGSESYELAAWVGARKTSIDCLEKRGKKGYFFIIGDENTYSSVHKDHINALTGELAPESIPTARIFEELKQKYHVFFILPAGANNGGSPSVIDHWKRLVGAENVLTLQRAEDVSELIATQIGLCEGTTTAEQARRDLQDHGLSNSEADRLLRTVNQNASNTPAVATGSVPSSGGRRRAERI
jgi:hypothetical protein